MNTANAFVSESLDAFAVATTSSHHEASMVMVADDDPMTRAMLSKHLVESGYEVILAETGRQALEQMHEGVLAVLLDLNMPEMSGLECLRHFRNDYPDTHVIMITASDEVSDAVEAIKEGASEYVTKPLEPSQIVVHVQQAIRKTKISREHRGLTNVVARSLPTTDFSSEAPSARQLMAQIGRVAQLDSTVLITGESGTGKTTVARMIHRHGPRSDSPFVAVNCASLPRDLIEAELFGHAKGAFTGAVSDRPGRVEIADGGTLFLDEIGDLPLDLQPKLLTFLQDRQIQRIGSNREITVDVRLIAATHQNLKGMVQQKRFREDLFYRLNVLALVIPPIRDRIQDIPLLARDILKRIAKRRGLDAPRLHPAAVEKLGSYFWPGNIREMENVLERATAFSDSDVIEATEIDLPRSSTGDSENAEIDAAPSLAGHTLADIEKRAIIETLHACGGNKAMTARELGISEKSIYNKMRRHGLLK